MNLLALILAGGRGTRTDILSSNRVKPAIPFAGKYRIIDFVLSNCSNSEIYEIGIITQYFPHSLNDHIRSGAPWDFSRRDTKMSFLQPHLSWYEGTADAVRKNIPYLKRSNKDYVIILSGDHVYKMDYRLMLKKHIETNSSLTIAGTKISKEEQYKYGMLEIDSDYKIKKLIEKSHDIHDLDYASMGIYIFNTNELIDFLNEVPGKDFGYDILPKFIKRKRTQMYEYNSYWRDVGTLSDYYNVNIELNNKFIEQKINLYDPNWRIFTRNDDRPGVKIENDGIIISSTICDGSIICGSVINSVISPGVIIHDNVIIKDSIIFHDTIVKEGTIIENCIIDKQAIIGKNCKIGISDDLTINNDHKNILDLGINIIGGKVEIPDNCEIGRNVRIMPYTKINTADKLKIKSGTTIE